MTEEHQSSVAPVAVGRVPSSSALTAFAKAAAAAGKRLVVGALIVDYAGRIYVQKRSDSRALFPGAWDIVGGHVEADETLTEALAREVMEETGWRLEQLGAVVEVLDWEAGGVERREVDMLVSVTGDLDNPLLEEAKHTEGRWLEPVQSHVLLERRSPTDVWVHKVVERAFALVAAGAWEPLSPQRQSGQ